MVISDITLYLNIYIYIFTIIFVHFKKKKKINHMYNIFLTATTIVV